MATTIVTTSSPTPWYVGSVSVTGKMILSWNEVLNSNGTSSTLNWKLAMSITASSSGHYGRSVQAVANGINIGGHLYNIPSSGNGYKYNGDTITSGSTVIEHDSNGSKRITVTVNGRMGQEKVYGSNTVNLTKTNSGSNNLIYDKEIKRFQGNTTPVLYDKSDTDFTTNGIGRLTGVTTCTVEETINGEYELTMTIRQGSMFFSDISYGSIIGVIPNVAATQRQPFEVYRIEKNQNGLATVNARHISYRLSYIPMKLKKKSNVYDIYTTIKSNSYETNPFTFELDSDIQSTLKSISCSIDSPQSCRRTLGTECILDAIETYNLTASTKLTIEYSWDNFKVHMHNHRGEDRGAEIRYGKNLKTIQAEETAEETITGYIPYWQSGDTIVVGSAQYVSDADKLFTYKRTEMFDCSSYYNSKPTVAQLNSTGAKLIKNSENNHVITNIETEYVDLTLAKDSNVDYAGMNDILLGDTVSIIYSGANISKKAEVTSLTYDVIQGRVESITLGEAKNYLTSSITQTKSELERLEEERKNLESTVYIRLSEVEQSVDEATKTAKEAQEAADAARKAAEEAASSAEKAEDAIVSDEILYLATNMASGVTSDMAGWTTYTQTMTPDYRYLWTHHLQTKANGNTNRTDPVLTGVYGETGPTGDIGPKGEDGTGITSVTDLYLASNSTTIPDRPNSHITNTSTESYNTWTLVVPTYNNSYKYYYTCMEILYSNGTYGWSQPVADVQLENSMKHVVKSIKTQYYISTSNTIQTGGKWDDDYYSAFDAAKTNAENRYYNEHKDPSDQEKPVNEFYIWSRTATTYVDNSVAYGTAKLESALKTSVDSNASQTVTDEAIISEINSVSKAVADTDESIRTLLEEEYSSTIQTSNTITNHFEKVVKEYVNNGDSEVLKQAESSFKSSLDGFSQRYTETVINPISDKTNQNASELETINTYLNYDAPTSTLSIGKSTSDVHMELDNDSLDFKTQSGETKAWIDSETGLGGKGLSLGSETDKSKRWNLIVSDDGKRMSIARHQ